MSVLYCESSYTTTILSRKYVGGTNLVQLVIGVGDLGAFLSQQRK